MLVLVSIIAAFPSGGAQAQHCNAKLEMQPIVAGFLPVPGALVCQFDDGHTVPFDSRILPPDTTDIQLVYLTDISAALPTTTGKLNGLGFADLPLHYARVVDTSTPQTVVYYASQIVSLRAKDMSGCLDGTIVLDTDESGAQTLEATSYHTLDAVCPDYSG